MVAQGKLSSLVKSALFHDSNEFVLSQIPARNKDPMFALVFSIVCDNLAVSPSQLYGGSNNEMESGCSILLEATNGQFGTASRLGLVTFYVVSMKDPAQCQV